MERDMEVIRKIALELNKDRQESLFRLDGVPNAVFNYHAQLMGEAGWVEIAKSKSTNRLGIPNKVWLNRLTMSGHDFVDAIKDETIWNKAKDHFFKPAVSWTLNILLEYMKEEIRRQVFGR